MKRVIAAVIAALATQAAPAHAAEWRELPAWVWDVDPNDTMVTFETFAKWPLVTGKVVVKGLRGPASKMTIDCESHQFIIGDGDIKAFGNGSIGDALCEGAFNQKAM